MEHLHLGERMPSGLRPLYCIAKSARVARGTRSDRTIPAYDAAMLLPPRVVPPSQPLGRLAFIARFVRNPLAAIPQAVYEEDIVPRGKRTLWVTSPELVRKVLLDERDKYRKLTQIRLLGPLLGKGILTSEGADWRWQRQATAPMFRTP